MDTSLSQTSRTSEKDTNQYKGERQRERERKRENLRIDVTIIKVALLRHPDAGETKFRFSAVTYPVACRSEDTMAEIIDRVLPNPMTSARSPPMEYEGISSLGLLHSVSLI
jgi:hypothetical protein